VTQPSPLKSPSSRGLCHSIAELLVTNVKALNFLIFKIFFKNFVTVCLYVERIVTLYSLMSKNTNESRITRTIRSDIFFEKEITENAKQIPPTATRQLHQINSPTIKMPVLLTHVMSATDRHIMSWIYHIPPPMRLGFVSVRPFVGLRRTFSIDFHETLQDCGLLLQQEKFNFVVDFNQNSSHIWFALQYTYVKRSDKSRVLDRLMENIWNTRPCVHHAPIANEQ